MTRENYLNFNFQCPSEKFYCDIDILFHLFIVYDCFHWQWQSWVIVTDSMALYRKSLLTSSLNDHQNAFQQWNADCITCCVSYKALCKYSEISSSPGLWIATDDIQGLCGITAEIPWQAPSHAFLFRCHHTRGESVGRGHVPPSSLKGRFACLGLQVDLGFTFLLRCDFTKTSSYFQLFKFTFLVDNISKLFFWTIVHGLKDSLHSLGDLNDSACKIY